jgi:hypothetical protein
VRAACSQRNLLDFNDITVDKQGRVLVAHADGCTGNCVDDASTTSTGKTGAVLGAPSPGARAARRLARDWPRQGAPPDGKHRECVA